jgi:probable rRNA maturation factor
MKTAKILLSALECERAQVSILITGDAEIQKLNRDWLGKDRPTDVMSWSQIEGEPAPTGFLGDVVISIETADRQARELGHHLDVEMTRLLAHGILHLLGHDHVHGGPQARKMRQLEDRIVNAAIAEVLK